MRKHVKTFESFSQKSKNEIETVRDLAKIHPEMWEYDYKWENTENPELEKDITELLAEYGYKFKEESDVTPGEYNDIKGYLDAPIEPI